MLNEFSGKFPNFGSLSWKILVLVKW